MSQFYKPAARLAAAAAAAAIGLTALTLAVSISAGCAPDAPTVTERHAVYSAVLTSRSGANKTVYVRNVTWTGDVNSSGDTYGTVRQSGVTRDLWRSYVRANRSVGGPDEPPPPHMIGNWVDEQGHLWVLAAQPRQDAQKAWEGVALPGKGGGGEVRVSALPAAYELYRTVIEVLDTNARRLIARHTFDGYIIAVLPDQRVASYVETESGIPVLSIHRLSLHRFQ